MSSPLEAPRPLAIPGAHKIRSEHLTRTAFTYVRQSSPMQVQLRKESQRRQYGLAETLVALGWPRDQVIVIDEDQGHSGAEKHSRPGFQRLVSEVALGHVGIVLGIETSRLARNSEDWQHLLNLCGVMDTLIGDSEGIYDLRIHNDRMLLGLKGTLSEYELHLLQQRMIDGAAYKARRGELYFTLPAGYVLSEDGRPELHPDEQVRATISEIFRSFRETGNALETYQELRAAGVRYPSRVDPLSRRPVQWSPLVYKQVIRVLTSPFYAGAYTFGRRQKVVLVESNGAMRKVWRYRPLDQCPVVIWDHHPGYITREEFEQTQERLRQNRRTFTTRGPANNGASLLAGLVKCADCGHTLSVNYGGTHNRFPYYSCRDTLDRGPHKPCLRFAGRALEERVEAILLSVLEPEGLEAVLLALEDLEERQERQKRLWKMEVERAAQSEERCRRKFEEVEPGNRLVSRRLEERWEEALKVLDESRRTLERRIAQLPPPLTEEEKAELRRVVAQVGKLWSAPTTTNRDRKEIARLLIHHVEANRTPDSLHLNAKIHWVSGHVTAETVKLSGRGRPKTEIRDSALQIIEHMAPHYTDREIAICLGSAGKAPAVEPRWSAWRVKQIRKEHGWEKRPRDEGDMVSENEARKMLGITKQTIGYWIIRGTLRSRQAYPNTRRRILREDVERLVAERKRLGMKGGHRGGRSHGL
ncbi:MAG: recombinase family protein [Thermoplasmata archaeon]